MAGRNWLAICAIGGGLLGGALGMASQDIFGGVFGGLLLGGVVGLAVRGKTRPQRPETADPLSGGLHDPHAHAHLALAVGMASASHAPTQSQGADAACPVDSGGFSAGDLGGADCGGGDTGGGGGS